MTLHAIDLDESQFEEKVLNNPGVVLVDFWAPWCGPCRAIAPMIEKIAQEFHGDVAVVKFNVDQSPNLSGQMGIRSVPTLMIFRQGELIKELNGAPDPHMLVDLLESTLSDQSAP